jgi:putative peptide zinc metalloprotease protein
MRFGPTSPRVSSILAKGLRRPKLRADLRVSEQSFAGEKSYVVKVPETNSYNRYGVTEYELLSMCDGTRTSAEVATLWNENHPDEPLAETEVMEFLSGIEAGVWEQSAGEKNLAILERIRDERKSRVNQSSVLYITFKAWDPDRTLAKIDPYLKWLFTPEFVIFSAIVFIGSVYLLAGDWHRVQADTASLYTFKGKTAYDIWVFWFVLLALGGIHEFGHGLTCKHFGGEVHQMGFMLIYFTPAFFTDTTDIMLFDRTSRRQWVIFAGIWVELFICAVSTFVWRFTPAGSAIGDIAYKTMLLSGIQGAFLNLNPLIKADGYYALSQFLHIDNLREDSFAYLRAWVRQNIFRDDVELPAATRRIRRVYVIFGITAVIYSTTLVILMLLFVKNIFVSKYGGWGYLLTVGVVYFFARKGIKRSLPQIRAWLREKREAYMAWKITRAQQLGAVGIAVLFLVPPLPSRVASDFVLEPGRDAHVRAQASGVVEQVFVKSGERVKQGQAIAVLGNPDSEADARMASQELVMANSALRSAEASSNSAKAAAAQQEQLQIEKESEVAKNKVEGLTIRAPFDGVIETPLIEQKSGQYLSTGEEFCEVTDQSTMKARILVRDWELEDVKAGADAQLKVLSLPYRTYSGRVQKILPAAALDRPVTQTQDLQRLGQQLTNYFAVVLEFPNPDGSLSKGMTGKAKIAGTYHPLAWQAGRGTWRWLRSQVW